MLKYVLVLITVVFSALTAHILTPYFIDLFKQGQRLQTNFKGELIPQGIGILFVFCSLPWYALWLAAAQLYLQAALDIATVFLLLLTLFAVSLLGFIDDMLGTRKVLGLKGHFQALLAGELTTGALKAIGGLLVASVISSYWSHSLREIIVSTLVLALFTNLLNLLDLRPGRAIKFYLCLLIVFGLSLIMSGKYQLLVLMLPFIGTVIGYFPFDLKASCMMGDAGSNVLGISAGMLALGPLDYRGKLIVLAILIAVHIFAERYSLSEIIAHNKILSLLDNLGRQN